MRGLRHIAWSATNRIPSPSPGEGLSGGCATGRWLLVALQRPTSGPQSSPGTPLSQWAVLSAVQSSPCNQVGAVKRIKGMRRSHSGTAVVLSYVLYVGRGERCAARSTKVGKARHPTTRGRCCVPLPQQHSSTAAQQHSSKTQYLVAKTCVRSPMPT